MLPTCIVDIIAHMAFSMRGRALVEQLDLCIAVHECIPAVFIEPVVYLYNSRFRAINPLHPSVPFIPLQQFLNLPSPRMFNLRALDLLVKMIDPARVRSFRTYKGILERRVRALHRADFSQWNAFLRDFKRLNHSVLYDITYDVLEQEWIAARELLSALKAAKPLPSTASGLSWHAFAQPASRRVGVFSQSSLSSRPRWC